MKNLTLTGIYALSDSGCEQLQIVTNFNICSLENGKLQVIANSCKIKHNSQVDVKTLQKTFESCFFSTLWTYLENFDATIEFGAEPKEIARCRKEMQKYIEIMFQYLQLEAFNLDDLTYSCISCNMFRLYNDL